MIKFAVSRLGILTILLAVCFLVLPIPSAYIERLYSQQTYLIFQNLVTPLSGLVSFAVFDFLLVTTVIVVFGWWVVSLIVSKRGRRWRTVITMITKTTVMVSFIYIVFLMEWGFNYRREPLTVKLDYEQGRVTSQSLVDLAFKTTRHLNELYPRAYQNRWLDFDEIPIHLGPAFQSVQRKLGSKRTAIAGAPKLSLLTPYFRLAGIDGMLSPFSLEILVNEFVLPFERPFVVSHEWAHLAGYAVESEASFVGWLICLSGDENSRYSAWIFMLPQLMRYLSAEEKSGVWNLMNDGPIKDLQAVSDRVNSTDQVIQKNARRIYDRYLKANRVEDGIASYGAVVDLVLGTQFWQQ